MSNKFSKLVNKIDEIVNFDSNNSYKVLDKNNKLMYNIYYTDRSGDNLIMDVCGSLGLVTGRSWHPDVKKFKTEGYKIVPTKFNFNVDNELLQNLVNHLTLGPEVKQYTSNSCYYSYPYYDEYQRGIKYRGFEVKVSSVKDLIQILANGVTDPLRVVEYKWRKGGGFENDPPKYLLVLGNSNYDSTYRVRLNELDSNSAFTRSKEFVVNKKS